MTRGDSDVYLLAAVDDRRFYLKVYRPPHPLAVAEAEGQLTSDLVAKGFPAVAPVCRSDGKYATAVDASEGIRPILIWTEAPLSRPEKNAAAAEAIGRTVGHLHNVTDTLVRRYDLPADTTDSVAELLPYAFEFMDDRDANLAVAAAEWGRKRIAVWSRESPEYGICHADLASVNIRSHPVHGITLFDFGTAAYTWRICDFLRFHPGDNCSTEGQARWDAFRSGYSGVRALPDKMDDLLPIFRLMRHLRSMGRSAGSCRLRMGTESPERFLPRDIQSLREHVQGIPELRDHLRAHGLL
jgi:Ser/Thr protein kinase RdoA (MazF antagonist)